MEKQEKRYDIKFFIRNTDILVFRAFLVSATSYRLISVEGFGINENYENLFLRIIKGKFKVKYYDKSQFSDKQIAKPQYIEINKNSAIENIIAIQEIPNQLVGVSIKSKVVELTPMLSFRYEGYSLNLKDGLLPKNANKVSNITTKLISEICVNNTDFGEVYQMGSRTGSTIIPFLSEKVDTNATNILIKIISDINKNDIDLKYIRENNKFSDLYKKVIKALKELPKIKGLEQFEIIINEQKYTISDLKKLDNMNLYNQEIQGEAEVRYYKGQLKSRKNRFVLVVEENNKDIGLHFDTQDSNFKSILKKVETVSVGNKIKYSGYSESEEVILIDDLIIL